VGYRDVDPIEVKDGNRGRRLDVVRAVEGLSEDHVSTVGSDHSARPKAVKEPGDGRYVAYGGPKPPVAGRVK
jgi:hypothetical protein